jgi:hypothetical protein
MSAHRRSDQRHDDLCAGGLRKCCSFSLSARLQIHGHRQQNGQEDRLPDKLFYVDFFTGDENRCVCTALRPQKIAPSVRRYHQRDQDSEYDY